MIRKIYDSTYAPACFFRTTVQPPDMKAMLQITEKCNLRCAHCFVSSEHVGNEMSLDAINQTIIPQFVKSHVIKVTLTGGEPLVHPNAEDIIHAFLLNGISVSVCTNGTLVDRTLLDKFSQFDNIHFNVSLDGFTVESHGRFRGGLSKSSFSKLLSNIELLGERKLLNGILTTPNRYATIEEYVALCQFAKEIGANYVLMNPLSSFGRGTKTQTLAYTNEEMIALKAETQSVATDSFEIVYIRFPNTEKLPIGICSLGAIPYVFCNGDVAICPYMVFAARSDSNHYAPEEFILGNILDGLELADAIKRYHLPSEMSSNVEKGVFCKNCNRGCYAIKISNDQSLLDCDFAMCPKDRL